MPESPTTDAPPQETRSRDSIGWLTSLLLHGALFAALAWLTLPELPGVLGPRLDVETVSLEKLDDALDIEDLAVEISSDLAQLDAVDASSVEAPAEPLDTSFESAFAAPEPVSLSLDAISSPIFSASAGVAGVGSDGRTGESRRALVAAKGGTRASELAVARALNWFADHQNPDGTWSLVHSLGPCRGRCDRDADFGDPQKEFSKSLTSGTSLALLPFLGAGETHLGGKHKRVVERGLRALVRLAKQRKNAPGASWADNGRLYSHGLSAIVLAEAYGLTRDPDLYLPAQAAIDYIAYAQDPRGGGWRYRPQEAGDTSATGWQIMALKSAQLAELRIPLQTASRASRFLDSVQVKQGERYRYMPPKEGEEAGNGKRTLTAVGLLCRMYMGMRDDDPRLQKGAAYLAEGGPSEGNYYHNYYAAQTIFHATGGEGELWDSWNEPMRDLLVEQQETKGHQRGSWWVPGPHNNRGGRLYTTSLATMTLEVYYRYLPLYQSTAVELEFPD